MMKKLPPLHEITAQDVMTAEPTTVDPEMSIRAFVETLEGLGVSGVPVVDKQGAVVGVVSKSDLLHACMDRANDYEPTYLYELMRGEENDEIGSAGSFHEPDIRVEDFMSDDPMTASPATPISTLAKMMHDTQMHRIIIVDAEQMPIGIVTSLDLVRVIAETPSPIRS